MGDSLWFTPRPAFRNKELTVLAIEKLLADICWLLAGAWIAPAEEIIFPGRLATNDFSM